MGVRRARQALRVGRHRARTRFDCSGLTQYVWRQAGVSIPRVAADQDAWTIPVPLSQLLPGDLVFYGQTDIHHVGIYIGDGLMINAPHTGTVVQVSSIWWSDLAGFGRVHAPGHAGPAAPAADRPASPPRRSWCRPPVRFRPRRSRRRVEARARARPRRSRSTPGPPIDACRARPRPRTTAPGSTTTTVPEHDDHDQPTATRPPPTDDRPPRSTTRPRRRRPRPPARPHRRAGRRSP